MLMPTMPSSSNRNSSPERISAIDSLAAACATTFIIILGIAAYWDSTIRVLHAFEALPYAAAALLCLRRRKFGYMLGAAAGAFWLWTAGALTTFVRNGFERIVMLLRTGHVDRLDILIAAPGALATGGLVIFSLWGYLRLRQKSWRDLALFGVTAALVAGFFLAIFALFAPQYLGMFSHIFGS
jgi:hypothetical protein